MKISTEKIVAPLFSLREDQTQGIEELAHSIESQGLLQPIGLRPLPDGRYQIRWGARRWEAIKLLGWDHLEVPTQAIITEATDDQVLVEALVENLQRRDLAPLEAAKGISLLLERTGWSMRELERQGIMTHARASQLIALLGEPGEVLAFLGGNTVTEGHLRVSRSDDLTPRERVNLLEKVEAAGLSVRALDALVKERVASKRARVERAMATRSTKRAPEPVSGPEPRPLIEEPLEKPTEVVMEAPEAGEEEPVIEWAWRLEVGRFVVGWKRRG